MNGEQSPHVVAQVTGEALLGRLDNVSDKLARIDTKVDGIHTDVSELRTQANSNTQRIGDLERWRAFSAGIAAVVTLLLTSGMVAAFVTALHH